MKYIYITIFILLIKISAFAQVEGETTVSYDIEGKYSSIDDGQLNRFKGTWVFTNDNLEIFKIKIDVQKRVLIPSLNHYIDLLTSHFCFSEDSSCNLNSQQNQLILDYSDQGLFGDLIYLMITDPITGKRGKGHFRIISSGQASWKLYNRSFLFGNTDKEFMECLL